MDAFERTVKEALEPYEVPYNSADWAQLDKALDKGQGTGRISRSGVYALLLGGSIAAASAVYVMLTPVPELLPGIATIGQTILENEAQHQPEQPSRNTAEQVVVTPALPVTTKPVGAVGMKANTDPAATLPTATASITPPSNSGTPKTAPNAGPMVRPSVNEACPGNSIEFAAENMPEGGIYLWNFGDGSFSNQPNPSHVFSKSGNFEVMLSHSMPGGGNIHNKPAADRIVIHEAPESSFNLLKQEYDNTVPSVHFENRSLRGKSYAWDFGDGSSSSIPHPDHVYKKEGVYQVTLTVTNANGCVDRSERTVRINKDYDLLAPKSFSPNADGVDDVFMPEALKTLGVKFTLSVFDPKSGQVIYETSDAQRPWNGRISNRGEVCSTGDYVWMVEMKDGEKLGGTYNGSIGLVR